MSEANLNVLISLKSKVDGFDGSDRALGNLVKGLAAAGAAYAVFAAKQALGLGSSITDLSSQANISAQAFQTLAATARDSGVEMEEVSKVLVMMRKNIQEGASGNAAMASSFAALGLSAGYLKSLAPERQLELIAKAQALSADKGAANNAVMNILGTKIGPKLRETLDTLAREGYDTLAASTAKIRLSDAQLKTLDDAGDKLGQIAYQLKLIGASAVSTVFDFFSDDGVKRAEAVLALDKKLGANAETLARDQERIANFKKQAAATDAAAAEKAKDAGVGGEARSYVPGYSPAEVQARRVAAMQEETEAAADEVGWNKAKQQRAKNEFDFELQLKKDLLKVRGESVDDTEKRRQLKFTADQTTLARQLATADGQVAQIEASRFLTADEKSRLIQPLLQKENDLIAARVKLLGDELLNNQTLTQEAKQQIQDRIDGLTKEQASVQAKGTATAPLAYGAQQKADIISLRDTWGTASQQISGFITNGIGTAVDGVSDGIYGMILGTKTWGQVFSQVGSSILQSLIKMGVQIVANAALGTTAQTGAATTAVATNATITASAAPAAAASSIASYGSAAVVGAAAAGVAIGIIIAMLASGGFAEGGYTGPGSKYQVAGAVHAGEYVFTQEDVSRIGLANLESMRFADRRPGYAMGGLVAPVSSSSSSAPSGTAPATRSGGTYHVWSLEEARRLMFQHGDFEANVIRVMQKYT